MPVYAFSSSRAEVFYNFASFSATVNSTVFMCYFPNWTQYRQGKGKYRVSEIDPKLCTHLIYSFAKITNGALDMFEHNDPEM